MMTGAVLTPRLWTDSMTEEKLPIAYGLLGRCGSAYLAPVAPGLTVVRCRAAPEVPGVPGDAVLAVLAVRVAASLIPRRRFLAKRLLCFVTRPAGPRQCSSVGPCLFNFSALCIYLAPEASDSIGNLC